MTHKDAWEDLRLRIAVAIDRLTDLEDSCSDDHESQRLNAKLSGVKVVSE